MGETISFTGISSDRCWIVISGVIEKAMMDRNGARRILGFHFRGEVCGLDTLGGDRRGYELVAASPAVVFPVTKGDLQRGHGNDDERSALIESAIAETAIAYRWTANLARDGYQRIAYLLRETFARLEASGMPREMFGTQTTIAQATGLSLVHVNKTLRQLVEDGCLVKRGRCLSIGNETRLEDASGGWIHHPQAVFWSVQATGPDPL